MRDKGEYLLAKRIARSHIEPFGRLFQQLGEERNPLVLLMPNMAPALPVDR